MDGRAIKLVRAIQKRSHEIFLKKNKSDSFCYCKVGRAITKRKAKVKSPIFQILGVERKREKKNIVVHNIARFTSSGCCIDIYKTINHIQLFMDLKHFVNFLHF